MEFINFTIDFCDEGKRLDVVSFCKLNSLSGTNKYTRSQIQSLIYDGHILLNGLTAKKNKIVKIDDQLNIKIPNPKNLEIVSQDIPINIVYEDNDLLIVNKEKGMVVHPAPGNYEGTLVNALIFYLGDSISSINGIRRPGIVHRIDKNTSGLLIIAKNDFSHKRIAEKIKVHDFLREYEAVVYGHLKETEGIISAPIGRDTKFRKRMAVTNCNSKEATTYYTLINFYENQKKEKFSHVKLKLETGRTHQIRVHMSYIGHPLAGDDVYGPKAVISSLGGQCLHAKSIGFCHPRTGDFLKVESQLPEYFKEFLGKLILI